MPTLSHRTRRALFVITLTVVVAGGGCVSDAGIVPSSSHPHATTSSVPAEWPDPQPDFEPELVEQVAAQAIGRYLAMTDLITSEGGTDPRRMASLTTPVWFPTEEAAFTRYRTEGLRTLGTTRLESLVVQSLWSPVTGGVALDVVACVDARWVWLVPLGAPDPPDGLMEWLMAGQDVAEVDDLEFALWSEFIDTHQPRPGTLDAVVVWLVGPRLDQLAIDGTLNWEGAHTCHNAITE